MSFSPSNALHAEPGDALSMDEVAAAIDIDRADAFAQLGTRFLTRLPAAPVPDPYLVAVSVDAARQLGIDPAVAHEPAFAEFFAGNPSRDWPADKLPYATVYSGHQFGVWAGQLGDGRAIGLGEIESAGRRFELQLKGAGRTPYSRMGDGRAVLRSSIREFLCSEAMHHLGIPTTRALTVIGSDLPVRRESTETSAIVTRVSESFVRFGHFEHFYSNDRVDDLKALADHVIDRFYPRCREADDPYLALLGEVMNRTADLMADWQAVGFCHGVMNTDNMSILGLTIDYGPFGFMDGFNAHHVCNHSDTQGRYSYSRQPQVGYWNLFCLAQALVPLFGQQYPEEGRAERVIEDAQRVLEGFKTRFAPALEARFRAKLGLTDAREGDEKLANALLEVMHANRADFTLTFRNLAKLSKADASSDAPVRDLFLDRAAFDAWAAQYRARLSQEQQSDEQRAAAMNRVNPKYVLRNHLAEQAIRQAKEKDFSEVERLLRVLSRPFDEQPEFDAYAGLPPDWASDLEVSCSS
ncbi:MULTISPECIES: protein adenylyltransferase SelO family protein [unclassified Caballeronia]|uniref:protein adenylyltransferase SelO n=1 Tax=unclassified Caballeronia TaxID=2646786 RepID=UPI0028551FB7|nr:MULTISPECIES: YdiU family protein [unclassified Caballeronia]MDR5750628.1 YdiU family protein [Caballeronia sp. LZ024]MDR5842339.1 YdiU family protein [Caballeronia sp. LZ031]